MSRYVKVLAALLVVLAIAVAILHYKRESVAREIANSVLRAQGLTATDLSIGTLGTDRILLSRLVLLGDDGVRYELRDLNFPLNFPSARGNTISIGQLELVPAPAGGKLPLAGILETVLALPANLPYTELTLSRFSMQDLPPIEDLAWRSVSDGQQLSFRVAALDLTASIAGESEALQRAGIRGASGSGVEAFALELAISRLQDGYLVEGPAQIQFAHLLPLLHALGIVPAEIAALEAGLTGSVSAKLPDAAELPAGVQGELKVAGPLAASYMPSATPAVDLRGQGLDKVSFAWSYPALEWTVTVPKGELVVSTADLEDFPVAFENLGCRSGIHCTLHVTSDDFALAVGEGRIGNLQLGGDVEFSVGDASGVNLLPGFRMLLSGIATAGPSAGSLAVNFASGATLLSGADNWSAEAGALELLLTELRNGELQVPTLPIAVSSLRIDESGNRAALDFWIAARAAALQWGNAVLATPGAAGRVQVDGGTVSATVQLSDAAAALSARLDARYELTAGRGSLLLHDASLHFDRQPLSAWLPGWPYPWDIVSGSWTANAQLEIAAAAAGWHYAGSLAQSVRKLAGHYNDIVFAGLDADLPLRLSAGAGIEVPPSSLSLALLEVGIPIEELSAAFALDVAGRSIEVSALSMTTLGGTITADPFLYQLQQETNLIMLRPQSIQLQFMVDLAEFDDIELNGSLSGAIPVTIRGESITVAGGRLESDPPGGVIRYGSGIAAEVVADDSIGLVSRALGNFQFDSLTSDVDYTEAGDLKLQMRLSGVNPDLDPAQPVILNLGVENNIPQLLRSLQATRAIEDLLQRKGNE